MRGKAYCAHPSIRHHWALRCMSRCPYQLVSLKEKRLAESKKEDMTPKLHPKTGQTQETIKKVKFLILKENSPTEKRFIASKLGMSSGT
ncbi:hypothetical protein TNCV_1111711 [Trichonephila clavipes]|nr:hypothetical protein TNCV_1111711 [Trichonephila clavipes]